MKALQTRTKRIIRLAVALSIYATDRIRDVVRRLLNLPSIQTTVVIYYHQMPDSNRMRFAKQMDKLLRWTTPTRIEDIDERSTETRRVVVTADDGWLSFIRNAVPELETRKIPCALFVVSHRLGDPFGDPTDRLISVAELQALRRDLITVGSHTATHRRLTAAREMEVCWELAESRTRLGQLLEHEVSLFCFPYSAFDRRSVNICRSAGYSRAFAAPSRHMPVIRDEFLVLRVHVEPSDWAIEFYLKLMNAYRGIFLFAALQRAIVQMFARSGNHRKASGSFALDDDR